MFGQNMIVLSSLDAARELLDKRSSIYSDRPRFVLFSDLCVSASALQITCCDTLNSMGWKNATTHLP